MMPPAPTQSCPPQDVYKRQERTLSALEEKGISRAVLDNLCAKGVLECSKVNKSIDLYSSIPLKNEPILLTEEQQAAYNAVSYTHLDVYKRQCQGRSRCFRQGR